MKVGMLTTWQTRCGIAAYTGALVEALARVPGLEVEVVPIREGLQDTAHYADQATRLNACDVVHIQHEYSFWGGYVPGKNRFNTLRRLIRPPVVLTGHTTTPVETLLALPEPLDSGPLGARMRRSYRRVRMKLLLPVLFRTRLYRRWVEVSPFASVDRVIVHTEEARAALISRGVAADRIRVLPAGIPPGRPDPEGAAAFRKRLGLEGRRVVALFGYVTPFKGNELMLEALKHLPDDVALVIAGGARTENERPYVEGLQSRVEESGLAGRAFITGFLPDDALDALMTAADLVVVPHTQATGSYSVTVPLGHGKPILASDLACFREIASQAACIRLFRAGDVEDLACALQSLLDDPAARVELASRTAEYAREHSWACVARATADIYACAISHSQPVASERPPAGM